jgi:hypothetical protein
MSEGCRAELNDQLTKLEAGELTPKDFRHEVAMIDVPGLLNEKPHPFPELRGLE